MFRPIRYINDNFASQVKKGVSGLKVLQDDEGFYVGRTFTDKHTGFVDSPYSRNSEYFETEVEATKHLLSMGREILESKEGFQHRYEERVTKEMKEDDIDYEEWKEMKMKQEGTEETVEHRKLVLEGQPDTYITEIEVFRSNAGYYIGRQFIDPEMCGDLEEGETLLDVGMWVPYDRISESYFKNREDAEKALETGDFKVRDTGFGFEIDDQIKEYLEKFNTSYSKQSKSISSDIDAED